MNEKFVSRLGLDESGKKDRMNEPSIGLYFSESVGRDYYDERGVARGREIDQGKISTEQETKFKEIEEEFFKEVKPEDLALSIFLSSVINRTGGYGIFSGFKGQGYSELIKSLKGSKLEERMDRVNKAFSDAIRVADGVIDRPYRARYSPNGLENLVPPITLSPGVVSFLVENDGSPFRASDVSKVKALEILGIDFKKGEKVTYWPGRKVFQASADLPEITLKTPILIRRTTLELGGGEASRTSISFIEGHVKKGEIVVTPFSGDGVGIFIALKDLSALPPQDKFGYYKDEGEHSYMSTERIREKTIAFSGGSELGDLTTLVGQNFAQIGFKSKQEFLEDCIKSFS